MRLVTLDRIVRVAALDEKVYSEIAEDKNALVQAIIAVFLTVVMGVIVSWIWYIGPSLEFYNMIREIWDIISSLGFYLIPILILPLPIWFIKTGIMHIVAKLLGGKADFVSYLKAIGFARVPGALAGILFISWLIGVIWAFTCYFIATNVVHRLSTGKAVIVAVIVPIILAVLITWMSVGIISGLEKTIGITQAEAIGGLLPFLLLLLLL